MSFSFTPPLHFLVFYSSAITTALAVIIIALLAFALIQNRLLVYFERLSLRTTTKIDDAVVAMVRSIKPPFYWFIAIYLGLLTLPLPPVAYTVSNGLLLGVVLLYAIRALGIATDLYLAHGAAGAEERTARRFLSALIKGALWIVAVLLLLSNLGINITSLIAGLGIGGVAIAFALQNILTDLFSSFAIYFDKPFVVGDFIIVGSHMGVVERIGIKTTRLRALQGEEIIISNRELTSVRVQNFHTMQDRRVETHIGIEYGTPRETIAGLAAKIRTHMEAIQGVRVERVHFASFGDSALDFDIVYHVPSGDYTEYMDRQQEINLAIMELFEKEKVAFAFPTRTVHVVSES
ncbi:MAG: hypothetical protein B7X04_02545 [Parcubacteria group bacterium 21-54-25]|nr:MAG: hypothetical protein B7X04_02545 [Parcubacteria group bacterium 21-54-25]HQU07765.1 mechanosensitive ion channel family protein [Candidatus Paceibacterota bacterium]